MNKEVTERRGRNHHGEGLPPLCFPGGHASHLHIINSVGNFSLLRNHIPGARGSGPLFIYLWLTKSNIPSSWPWFGSKSQSHWGQGIRFHFLLLFLGHASQDFYTFFFKLFEFFCKQLNSPGGKRERSWEGGEDIY